jgi:hypothetical protein
MNKNQRIFVNLDEYTPKFINTTLEQNINNLEILSLNISQKDIYQNFNADYGVVVGRVIANGGVGIPNAKISIFIPIDDNDKENADIYAIYPYEKPYDKNIDGRRYNLLPRVAKYNPVSNTYKPNQPFGSFPTKEEVVTNETWLEVYKKYYKYSTLTNSAGDYMLFGVPIGVQTVHMSVDVTDIGEYSMKPIDMVTALGYSPNLFTDNGTKIKPSTDLQDLPNIETQEISVDVVPFWGDTDNFEIGITRQDFRIRAVLVPSFIIFGSHMTMGISSVYGDPKETSGDAGRDPAFYKTSFEGEIDNDANAVDPRGFRQSEIDARVYYLPTSISDEDADAGNFNPLTQYIPLDDSNFFFYNDVGQFAMSITCNRKKIVTDQFGNRIEVASDNSTGVFTEFRGTLLIDYNDLDIIVDHNDKWIRGISSEFARARFKFPQTSGSTLIANDETASDVWRKEHKTFKAGKYYGLSQFYVTHRVDTNSDSGDEAYNVLHNNKWNIIYDGVATTNPTNTAGTLKVGGFDGLTTGDTFTYNDIPSNGESGNIESIPSVVFGAQWLNFNVWFPQFTWAQAKNDVDGGYDNRKLRTADMFYNQDDSAPKQSDYLGYNSNYFVKDNLQNIIGGEINTKFFTKTNLYQTDFSECDKDDLVTLNNLPIPKKGFNNNELYLTGVTLNGNYLYRTPTVGGSSLATAPIGAKDDYSGDQPVTNYYFSKGINNTDCIKLLFDLNLV